MTPIERVNGPQVDVSIGARVSTRKQTDGLDVIVIEPGDQEFISVSIKMPLARAEGYWHGSTGDLRTLPADWRGNERISLVASVPMGCLFDDRGRSVLAFSFDTLVEESHLRFGVSEEEKKFVVLFERRAGKGSAPVQLAFASPGLAMAEAVVQLRNWLGKQTHATPMASPESGKTPVFSTWYAYSQAIDAPLLESNAKVARELGCRSIFVDDGWQVYGNGRWYAACGDWVPDLKKFPDFKGHVRTLQNTGLAVVAWIGPLLLGSQSDIYPQLKKFASFYSEPLRTQILDPRFAEVRAFFVSTCIRLIEDYGLDGLKIDFLNEAMNYAGTPSDGDIDDIGQAMFETLEALRDELLARGLNDLILEYRQPYVGPGVAAFANVFRAFDCPADVVVNRRSLIDARLLTSWPISTACAA